MLKKLSTCQRRIANNLCPSCGIVPERKDRQSCNKCLETNRLKTRKRSEQFPELCIRCRARHPVLNSVHCERCEVNSKISAAKYRHKQKLKIFKHYGGCCACCGNPNMKLLQIDHINNDGCKTRKKNGNASFNVSLAIVKNNFPNDLQLLCANCHMIKTIYGKCAESDHDFYKIDTTSDEDNLK